MKMLWPREQVEDSQRVIVTALRQYMRICRDSIGLVSFNGCLAEARKQHQKEVSEAALNAPTK